MSLRGYKKKWGRALWTQFVAQPPQPAKPTRGDYNAAAREWLRENRACEACQRRLDVDISEERNATQVHHKHGRRGALLTDESLWVAVCSDCHRWIHDHPAAATLLGLLAPKGQWNRKP